MIQKFQQGGSQQLSGSILAQILQMPKEQLQLLMQAFSQWALLKGLDIKLLQSNPQVLEQALGQFIQEVQSQQTQAARHGSKLNYIKSLKRQCAEDEELVYYKKGGKVGCDCVKKASTGAELNNDKKSKVVLNFKKDLLKKKELRLDPKTTKKLPGGKYPKNWSSQDRQTWEREHGDNDEGAAVSPPPRKKEDGGKVQKNCGGAVARFKAQYGTKMKKHFFGGLI